MTLEHRLLLRNWNKMNLWKCMVLRPNVLKIHIQNAIKTTFMNEIT